jgi:Putative metallopeptidase
MTQSMWGNFLIIARRVSGLKLRLRPWKFAGRLIGAFAGYFMALVAAATSAAPAFAQENINIIYEPPTSAKYMSLVNRLHDRKALETLQQFLSPLQFPVTVMTKECGDYYASYKPGGPLTICYEYVDLIESVLPDEKGPKAADPEYQDMLKYLGRIGPVLVTREMATVGPFVQYVLHETALVVFNNLQVPIWGRLHDAADYASAFLLLQFGTDLARKTIYGTAYFLNQWDQLIREDHLTDINYVGGIRPTLRQRYYNVLCIGIGKDPIGFSSFIAAGRPETRTELPLRRIRHCRGSIREPSSGTDYDKVRQSFNELIMPKLDSVKLEMVRGTQWIPD